MESKQTIVTVQSDDRSAESQTSSARFFAELFQHRDAISRHVEGASLPQRAAYVASLLKCGHSRRFVKERAAMLLDVVRFFPEKVEEFDAAAILVAARARSCSRETADRHARGITGEKAFAAAARSWVRYVGAPGEHPEHCGDSVASRLCFFERWLRDTAGYLPSTTTSTLSSVRLFLTWSSARHQELSAIRLEDVDAFLASRRAAGRRGRTITGYCRALRVFFRYAEEQGLSRKRLSRDIQAPRSRKPVAPIKAPSWPEVRSMLASLDDRIPSTCRAKAVLLLASIYGLRRSEITRLTLDDLDWRREVLSVRRAKGGRFQQFPLQFEVGEAILRYIEHHRPKTQSRRVFLALKAPWRPADNLGPAMRKVMAHTGAFRRPWGMHALRHACATELLRQGTALSAIAELLGHRSLRSVGIYAQCDERALRKVANLDLRPLICD